MVDAEDSLRAAGGVIAHLRDDSKAAPNELVCESASMQRLLGYIRKIAVQPGPVLICGATGTGKTRLALEIHNLSSRRRGPFVKRHCAVFADGTLLSDLFGHRRGAFTNAVADRRGALASADGGTLLLDDIDTLPLGGQQRLLGFFDDQKVTRLGDEEGHAQKVDVRIIATTNKDPESLVQKGLFCDDLLHRLNRWRLIVPPLKERPEDVEVLARLFLQDFQPTEPGGRPLVLDASAIDLLKALPWDGNIRQLEEVVRNVALFGEANNGVITQDTVVRVLFVPGHAPTTTRMVISPDLTEDARIQLALKLTRWDITKAARIAGCSRGTIHARIKQRGWIRP
jgi:transcriptional regulator with GAF, ATPase, and Fis domain